MAQSVYIETTIVSYLTAWRSHDLVLAAHQQITRDWWALRRADFNLFTSELVLIEAASGDPDASRERLEVLLPIRKLEISEMALDLCDALLAAAALPVVATRDAQHVGICAVNGIEYLLTWNCRHLANATLRDRIGGVCEKSGYRAPIICTPGELLGESHG
jgi:hypothetical protein